MGFVIKKFTLQAIKEIISKEKIAPSLFWVIPLGKPWTKNDLFKIYNQFNEVDSLDFKTLCHFFVKGDPDSNFKASNNKNNLSASGFNHKNNLDGSSQLDEFTKLLEPYEKKNQKSLIFLCSNFDLPGWGLSLNLDKISIDEVYQDFIEIIKKQNYENLINLTQEVSVSFKQLELIRNKLPKFQGDKKNEILSSLETAIISFNESFNSNYQIGLIIKNSEKLNLDDELINSLKKFEAFLIFHNNVTNTLLLINNYKTLILEKKYNEIINLVENNLKQIASKFKYIPDYKIDLFVNRFEDWLYETKADIKVYFKDLHSIINKFYSDRESEYDNHYPKYIKSSSLFLEEIMNISPRILIDLEEKFKKYTDVISWDQPRMIGWKASILSKHPKTVGSFVEYLNELFPESKIDLNQDDEDELLNGDFFTDYFHHILLENTSMFSDKRKLAEKMIGCFDLSQRKEILKSLNFINYDAHDKSNILSLLGWEQDPSYKNTISLISFFTIENDMYVITNPKLNTWNDLRKCLESYLDDLTSIIKSHLISDNNQIQNLILRRHPDFSFTPGNNTSGTSLLIIEALGPKWKEDYDWGAFINILNHLIRILNTNNHWDEDIKREEHIANELNPLFNKLFILVKDYFKVMPLHFRPISSHLCDLYSGEAWSHDLNEKKQIRIIIKEIDLAFKSNKEMLIWNPSKINPTVVKYKILK